MSLKKVIACVRKNKSFLITAHTNLEGDALGAELAFARLVERLGKKATIVNEDDIPYGYNFLPGVNKVLKYGRSAKETGFDCFVVLDCSDLKRTGEVYRINLSRKPVLNIDHHISNEKFGDINWVEPHASSCCEMVYKLYEKLNVPLDKDAAMPLYVGILTDTGSFRYSNCSSLTHAIVAKLLKSNLDVREIYQNVYENIPFADMQLLSRILPTVKRQAQGKIVWFQLKRNLLKNKKLSFDLSEHILSFGRAIKDAQVVVLFKENLGVKDEVRINFRSHGKVDVNRIAKAFGGGGHKTASGATVKGKIDSIRRKVLAKIREELRP